MFAFLLRGRERAQSCTVHERPNPPSDRVDRAEALEFVKDGFAFAAFAVPLVWLAMHRIWMGALAYVAVVAAVLAVSGQLGFPPIVPGLALLALHLMFGNEADEILRSHLTAQGWTMVGQVTGTGPLDCERRFFDSWLPSVPMVGAVQALAVQPVSQPQVALTPPRQARPGGILGNLLAPLKRRDRA